MELSKKEKSLMNEILEKSSEKKSENYAESTLDEEISENNFSKEDYLNYRLEHLLKLETTASQQSFESKLGEVERESKLHLKVMWVFFSGELSKDSKISATISRKPLFHELKSFHSIKCKNANK